MAATGCAVVYGTESVCILWTVASVLETNWTTRLTWGISGRTETGNIMRIEYGIEIYNNGHDGRRENIY